MNNITIDHHQKFLDTVRRFNKRIFNSLVLKVAGTSYSPFAVINHIGRRSGKSYKTPLLAMLMGEQFIFALTYGLKVDWYRNVLAAGKCTLLRRGEMYNLEEPEIMEQENALLAFPRFLRLFLRLNNVQQYFRMIIVTHPAASVRTIQIQEKGG